MKKENFYLYRKVVLSEKHLFTYPIGLKWLTDYGRR